MSCRWSRFRRSTVPIHRQGNRNAPYLFKIMELVLTKSILIASLPYSSDSMDVASMRAPALVWPLYVRLLRGMGEASLPEVHRGKVLPSLLPCLFIMPLEKDQHYEQ